MAIETPGNVRDWLRAANPFRSSHSPEEARRAARVGAWALVIYALASLGGAMAMVVWPEIYLQAAGAAVGGLSDDPRVREVMLSAARTGAAVQFVGALVWSVVLLGLGVAQWRWTTAFLPGLLVLLILYGLLALAITALLG